MNKDAIERIKAEIDRMPGSRWPGDEIDEEVSAAMEDDDIRQEGWKHGFECGCTAEGAACRDRIAELEAKLHRYEQEDEARMNDTTEAEQSLRIVQLEARLAEAERREERAFRYGFGDGYVAAANDEYCEPSVGVDDAWLAYKAATKKGDGDTP